MVQNLGQVVKWAAVTQRDYPNPRRGPDPTLNEEIGDSSSLLIGAVAYRPEKYGSQILTIVLQCLDGQAGPPAVYAEHKLIARKEVVALSSAGSS
jgi:hypothetical protein